MAQASSNPSVSPDGTSAPRGPLKSPPWPLAALDTPKVRRRNIPPITQRRQTRSSEPQTLCSPEMWSGPSPITIRH